MHESVLGRVLPLVVALAILPVADSQEQRAVITGLVRDSGGRAIADARLELEAIATGTAFHTRSNSSGQYTFPFLSPGPYSLHAEADQFAPREAPGVILGILDHRQIDFQLEIAAKADSVTVADQSLDTNVSTSGFGTPVARNLITDLPNNGRNIYQYVWAAPGVTKASTYWGSIENFAISNATSVQINGGIRRENETVLDGVTNTLSTRDVAFQPPVEAVEQVRVQLGNYDASFGRFGGGVVAITTKSGSNAFHGTLHETNKNAALAANAWVDNFLGNPRPRFVNNTFGIQTGGPIVVPKLWDGRNRAFFMLAYEGLRQRGSGADSAMVPTEAQRLGDYSNHPRTIYDPLSTMVVGGRAVRSAFPGNRIPGARLDPVAQRLLTFVPLPNLAGRSYPQDNYAHFDAEESNYDQLLARADFVVRPAQTLYVSFGNLPYEEFGGRLYGGGSPAEPSTKNPLRRNYQRGVIDWAGVFSPRLMLNVRGGFVRYVETRGNPTAVGFDPRTLGFSPTVVAGFSALQFPAITVDGGYAPIGSSPVLSRLAKDAWSGQANMTYAAGRHLLTAGTEARLYHDNTQSPGAASGRYTFTRAYTQADPARSDSISGDELASLLLGYPSSGAADLNIDPAFEGRYFTIFTQDSWRITPRVQIQLGIRYDYERPYRERYNRMLAGFDLTAPSPLAVPAGAPSLHGAVRFAGQERVSSLAFTPDRNNVQPRISFATHLRGGWVLRGGYGLFYLGTSGGQPTTGFNQSTAILSSLDGGNTPRLSLANAFPEGLTSAIGSSLGASTGLGGGVSAAFRDRVTPYSHQLSFGLRRALPGGFIVEANYSGNFTRRYPVSAALNVIPASELGKPVAYYREMVPNPMAGLLPNNPAKNGPAIAREDLLLPFPQYTGVNLTDIPIGRNSTHALQAQLTRRYSAGITAVISYTISKTLEQLNLLNSQDFRLDQPTGSHLEKRLAEFDVPQKLAALAAYELPVGRGKRWLNNGSLSSHLAGGWQLNTQFTLQSGFPINYPNAGALVGGSAKLDNSEVNLYHAFNTTLFPRVVPDLRYALRTFPTRFSDVRLQPLNNLDFSIAKKTRISESMNLEIRSEFLNAANHPWFSRIHSRGLDVTRPEFGWYQLEEQNQNRLVALVGKFTW